MKFFFYDFVENIKAPSNFVTKVMISLDSTIYNTGEQIVRMGQPIDSIIFFVQGGADMIG